MKSMNKKKVSKKNPKKIQKKKVSKVVLDKVELTEDKNHNYNWFPGHMMKALRDIKSKIHQVDIVLEIRDARSPLATGNQALKKEIGGKSHLIVLNKANLARPEIMEKWKAWLDKEKTPYIFVNGLQKTELNSVIKYAKEIINSKNQKSNPDAGLLLKYKFMIVGLPNTGKSTIINRLAKRDASKVADKPGQTRQQLWVNAGSDLDILDTPGVMPPNIATEEQALWLASLHAIPSNIIDDEDTACFIIRYLLKTDPTVFTKQYKFSDWDKDLISTLNEIAKARGCLRQKGEYDYDRVYKLVIQDLRKGDLGLISFGHPPIR